MPKNRGRAFWPSAVSPIGFLGFLAGFGRSGPGRFRAGFGRSRGGSGPILARPDPVRPAKTGPGPPRTARDRPGPGRIRTARPGQKPPAIIGGPTTRQKADGDRWGQRSSSVSAVNEPFDRPSIVHQQRSVLRSSMIVVGDDHRWSTDQSGLAIVHRRRSTSSMIVR